MNATHARLSTGLVAAALLAGASGCDLCGGPRPADADRAQTTLRAALDAWVAGAAPADLERRADPIHVADAEWSGGLRLVGYRADGAGRLVGFDMTYPVVLEL